MKVPFVKYQGTGNDFIIIDDRNGLYGGLTTERIHRLCDRRFGIGADGLMLLQLLDGYDFQMRYFNADGREGSLCGNGGRCMVRYAWQLGIRKDTYRFLAADGGHEARIEEDGTVALRMGDVDGILRVHSDHIVHTGSPHYVRIVQDVMDLDVYKKGSEIRNSEPYKTEGINVNFVEQTTKADGIIVRTFERGVEDETLSCGTGVTAAALVCH
ncbi:MAG: hypothetical protein RJA57_107, partial [Bacteroidota bacterium]